MEYQGNHTNHSAGGSNAGVHSNDPKPVTVQQAIRENVAYLIEQLEAGHSEALTAFLDAMARFHNYSFGNVLLIARQRPGATHVAGIRTWNKLGRRVKRGEKGIAILAPVVSKRSRQPEEDSQPEETENPRPVLRGFRHVYVWDEAQTEGAPLPTLGETTGEVGEYLDRLRDFVAARGIRLEYREDIAPALGVSYGGRIAVLPGQSKPEEFTALVHETAHEFLHHAEGHTDQTVRETEAEAVAFVVARAVGLNAGTSVAYIQLYHGDAELLIESLEVVQQTASQILSAIQPEQFRTSTCQVSNTEAASGAAKWLADLSFNFRNRDERDLPLTEADS
jgi:antirestriction protein ArdC